MRQNEEIRIKEEVEAAQKEKDEKDARQKAKEEREAEEDEMNGDVSDLIA